MPSSSTRPPRPPAPRGRPVGPAAPSPGAASSPSTQALGVGDAAITGIVLAGGRSRRMGTDKAFIELAGRPLIEWVLDALGVVAAHRVIVTHVADERFERFGLPVVVDHLPARCPLSGLHAGLAAAPTDLCVAVACDLPLVRPTLLALLADAAADVLAAVPDAGATPLPDARPTPDMAVGGLQPLLAAYRRGCIPAIERLLADGPAPASMVASAVASVIVGPDRWRTADPDGRSFHNVNTLTDLATAAQWMNRLAP